MAANNILKLLPNFLFNTMVIYSFSFASFSFAADAVAPSCECSISYIQKLNCIEPTSKPPDFAPKDYKINCTEKTGTREYQKVGFGNTGPWNNSASDCENECKKYLEGVTCQSPIDKTFRNVDQYGIQFGKLECTKRFYRIIYNNPVRKEGEI
jgi:hypothetical protein